VERSKALKSEAQERRRLREAFAGWDGFGSLRG
jgi:hypothetical protein